MSGLNQQSAKLQDSKMFREFESLSHRQMNLSASRFISHTILEQQLVAA